MHKFSFLSTCIFILLVSLCSPLVFADITEQTPEIRSTLKIITDIRETAKEAKARQLPILMMFGTEECPYCYLLREDFLIPMIISKDYTDKVIFREVHVGGYSKIIDFSGKKISVSEFSRRYKVRLFPTTVFIDSNGKVLVNNIMGITTPSLFGGTLDDQIDKALAVLKKQLMNKH